MVMALYNVPIGCISLQCKEFQTLQTFLYNVLLLDTRSV